MMDSAIRGTLIVSAMNDDYFSLSFSKKVNDGLKRRAVGNHNQSDVYLAIVKRLCEFQSGTIGLQTYR